MVVHIADPINLLQPLPFCKLIPRGSVGITVGVFIGIWVFVARVVAKVIIVIIFFLFLFFFVAVSSVEIEERKLGLRYFKPRKWESTSRNRSCALQHGHQQSHLYVDGDRRRGQETPARQERRRTRAARESGGEEGSCQRRQRTGSWHPHRRRPTTRGYPSNRGHSG